MQEPKKYFSKSEALEKARRYCAYQERCQSEVRSKLLEWGQKGNTLEDIIAQLISEDFINEERFAKAFARGKFKMKNWGTEKIKAELKRRNISDYCIRQAMHEIENEDVLATVKKLILKKSATIKESSPMLRKNKLAAFLIRKGFESSLVWSILNDDD